MAEQQINEASEKLNQETQKTKQMSQLQTTDLVHEYSGKSIEMFKQQLKERRSALENLPECVLWGQEECVQALFQPLMENYVVAKISRRGSSERS